MDSTLYCQECGRANASTRSVCKRCGTSLISASNIKPVSMVHNETDIQKLEVNSKYRYLAVPFVGHLSRGVFSVDNAHKVTKQLQELIDQYSHQGWDFYRIDKVNIQVTPGCLASLLGAQVSFITFDQVVFRQSVNEKP